MQPVHRTVLLRPADVAELLGVTENTLAKWRLTGEPAIPYVKLGGRIRYPAQAVEDAITANMRGSTSDKGGA